MKNFILVLLGAVIAFNVAKAVDAPYDMYVDPGTYSCLVTWDDDNNSAWNLRYRLYYEDAGETVLLHSLNGSAYSGSYGTAVTFAAPWGGTNTYSGNGIFYFRNNYNGANSPGNITYTIPAGYTNATFIVKIVSASNSYGSGNLAVETPQTAAVNQYFSAGSTKEWTVVGSSGEKITITTTDNNYSLDISLIGVYTIIGEEWTYVNGLNKTAYTIEDLNPETDYEVQVQAIGNNGSLSDWTRPDVFTTLAEGEEPIIPSVHIMGEVDDQAWAPDAGTKMEYDPDNEIYTATVHVEAGKSFGFTTELDANGDMGGWNYILPYRFGPESNGEFYLTDERLGQTLTLSQDNFSDVYILKTGDYEVTVSLEQRYIIIGRIAGEVTMGDVNKDGKIDVDDATALIAAILNNTMFVETDHYDPVAANMNGDDSIDVSDVTALINLIISISA